MSAKADARARRKQELLLLARIERLDLSDHLRELLPLRKPANFAVIGARILQAWRSPGWVPPLATFLASRGLANGRLMRALRYAGFAFAAWRTFRLFRHYAGSGKVDRT